MTLALILLFGIVGTPATPQDQAAPPSISQEPSQQSTPESKQTDQKSTSQQEANPASRPTASAPGQAPTSKPIRKRRRKKKVVSQNCLPSTGTTSSPAQNGAAGATGSDPSAAATGTAQTPNTPCPPPKIVVRHGGTSDPSIQLAGDQPPATREATNRMLGATEANLKNLSSRQLNNSQQDMVSQIRQFMQQSRTAMSSGDFERAKTLAWKAQLLSEELVKPAK